LLKVIAIEPNRKTMRHLATSVRYGNVTDRIVLLHNAVTNVSNAILYLLTDMKNRGDTRVSYNKDCKHQANMVLCRHDSVIRTITLNDLLRFRPVRDPTTRWRVIMKVGTMWLFLKQLVQSSIIICMKQWEHLRDVFSMLPGYWWKYTSIKRISTKLRPDATNRRTCGLYERRATTCPLV